MVLVKDLKKDIFGDSFLEYLPEYCEFCGSPNEVLESFTSLRCSNPKCISKIAGRLKMMLNDIGVFSLDLDDCMNFLRHFQSENPYSIFLYNPNDDGELFEGFGIEKSKSFYKSLNKKRGMLLWEYIKIGNFKELIGSAEKLFKDYNDINSFYLDMSTNGIPFIQRKLLEGTQYENDDSYICVDAVKIFHVLQENKEDIEEGLQGVVLLKPMIKMGVFFANKVDGFDSNKDFLYAVNKKLKNNIYLYPTDLIDDSLRMVYWEDTEFKNTMIEQIKNNNQKVRIVNSENIFTKLLEICRE